MAISYIRIKKGTYRNETVAGKCFPLIKQYQPGKKGGFVTVDGSSVFGKDKSKIRIKVSGPAAYEFMKESEFVAAGGQTVSQVAEAAITETDDEVIDRIKRKFDVLTMMTRGTIAGDIRAMIVTGPPGVGKSYNIEEELERANIMQLIASKKPKYQILKGACTPIGLYCTLYKNSEEGHILVFDDSDDVFYDDLSLNILKAALDSGKRRRITWNSDSAMLRREGVPSEFDFKGSIIFITNLSFDNIRSKTLRQHLEALESRCHYLDLTLNTLREKFLRIKQIAMADTRSLFARYEFTESEEMEILDFMNEKRHMLREMSLRMALKVADMYKMGKDVGANWKDLTIETCCRKTPLVEG